MDTTNRIEKDSMGEIKVPMNALYGAQTQRAINNFPLSGIPMPSSFIRSLALIKAQAAQTNLELKLLDPNLALAIIKSALAIYEGKYHTEFPIDIFQTGSGTSSNMNANEVIAHLACLECKQTIHPNDHVNMGQSSNDIIPSAIHLSASLDIHHKLLPNLEYLHQAILKRSHEFHKVVKTGRTHLMDAMPLTLGQELSGWAKQIEQNIARLKESIKRLNQLALGGTAVGTGINSHPDFAHLICKNLSNFTKISFSPADNYFEALSCQDSSVEISGQLKTLAVSLLKIANDLRWMNSGPLSGIAEIALPAIQPGSSIMPGKVNPVIPEAISMIAAQVIGNDTTITIAGQSGNFQLNVMLPVIAYNLLQSIEILSTGAKTLAEKAINGFTVNFEKIKESLTKNPILITALNPVIGYELGASIAKKAYAENRAIIEVAQEMTNLPLEELQKILDPYHLTQS